MSGYLERFETQGSGTAADPYEDQLKSAVYRAERDQARQECERLQRKVECLEDDLENIDLELAEARRRLRDSVPRETYGRKRAALLNHIAECETALGKRNERIRDMGRHIESLKAKLNEVEGSKVWLFSRVWQNEIRNIIREHTTLFSAFRDACGMLGVEIEPGDPEKSASPRIAAAYQECKDELERRLMPSGYEWPRYEDSEPVILADHDQRRETISSVAFEHHSAVEGRTQPFVVINPTVIQNSGSALLSMGERVKRPAPKVLDADGVEIRVGDSVWGLQSAIEYVVDGFITDGSHGACTVKAHYVDGLEVAYLMPSLLAHRAPVLAADGLPLREGETVWGVTRGVEMTVDKVTSEAVYLHDAKGLDYIIMPRNLTHERPDSWERLCEDATKSACAYFNDRIIPSCSRCSMNKKGDCDKEKEFDLERRAKALAERGQ